MRILMLKGSPNIHGSSAILAESFADGASEAGHDVRLVDVTHANIHPCLGCIRCGYEGPCAQKDGMKKTQSRHFEVGYAGFCHSTLLLRLLFTTQNRN